MLKTDFELNGSVLTVKPAGELDSVTSPLFEADFLPRLTGVSSVIVDFAQVSYISSAGLRVLLTAEQPGAPDLTGSP